MNNSLKGKLQEEMFSAGLRHGALVTTMLAAAKAIFVLVIKLSFIAAIWLFLFDYRRWPGIALFFVLMLVFGDIVPYKKSTRQ